MNRRLSFDPAGMARVLLLAVLLAAGGASPQLRTKATRLTVGTHPLVVEVAATDADREKGLMFRTSMPKDEGMLFVFDELGYHAMWMKNTLIPLSVAFVDPKGVIVSIHDMEPQTLEPHQAQGPAIYAIETNKGWFAARKIKPGDKVTGLPKAK